MSIPSDAPNLRREAFLLYNSRDQRPIDNINRGLRREGISTWYAPDDLPAGQPSGDLEREALAKARLAVVFLSPYGWGPHHRELTGEALQLGKRIIPVLLGGASKEDRSALGGLFEKLQYIDFRTGEEEEGIARLVRSIQGDGRQPKPRPKPQIDPAETVETLIRGDADDRAETLEELLAIGRAYDLSDLAREASKRLLEFPPQDSSGEHERVRVALVSAIALSADLDDDQPHRGVFLETLDKHSDVKQEPRAAVRYAVFEYTYRAGVLPEEALDEAHAAKDPDPEINVLLEAIAGRKNPEFYKRASEMLRSHNEERVTWLVRALGIVIIPELVPDICATLPWLAVPTTFYTLTEPALLEPAARALQNFFPLDHIVRLAADAMRGGGRYLRRRIVDLLRRLDQAGLRDALRQVPAGVKPEEASALLAELEEFRARFQLAGYASDATENLPDSLGIAVEVRTLCSVILSTDVHPPLSIGLFGDWGTGKTFFMERMHREIQEQAKEAADSASGSKFHSRVAQITFNAWHYMDANLWASLVSHIIEDLARQVEPEQDAAVARRALISKLDTAQQLRTEAEGEKERAQQARSAAESNLSAIAQDRAHQQVKLTELRATDFWELAQRDAEVRSALEEAANELGIPSVMGSLSDLDATIREAHGAAGQARALALSVFKSDSRVPLLALIAFVLLVVPAIVWGLNHWLKDQPFFVATAAFLANVGAAAVALAKILKSPLEKVRAALKKLDEARRAAAARIDKKKSQKSKEEEELEKQVNELRAKETSATQQLTAAESRVQEVEAKIREIDEGRSLAKYLLERFQAEDYRKHLGLVSTIRRDFENLSKLLAEAAKQTETEPIQRIIIYVDDLDRCPTARVMEVLQAVHLLLAFPLFVVVVGVDPRWLMNALERSYSAFRGQRQNRAREWITTPQNYLEKIFQIPFSLRPMGQTGFEQLVRAYLPATTPREQLPDATAPVKQEQAAAAEEKSQAGEIEPSSPQGAARSRERPVAETSGPDGAASALETPMAAPTENAARAEQAPRINYEALRIEPWESAFAERLFAFIPSPRAAKRFTNIYRLLKAPLESEDLRAFEGTSRAPGDFRAAMILLALLTGFPESAGDVLFAITRNTDSAIAPGEFFRDPAKCGVRDQDRDKFLKCFEPLLSNGMPGNFETFSRWAPRVARFSFQAAKSAQS